MLIQTPPQLRLAGQDVEDAALRECVQHHLQFPQGLQIPNGHDSSALSEAYKKCGDITKMYAKTFYLGTQLMTPEKARAIWAIYVWCRRTDELVDGPNASRITPMVCSQDAPHAKDLLHSSKPQHQAWHSTFGICIHTMGF